MDQLSFPSRSPPTPQGRLPLLLRSSRTFFPLFLFFLLLLPSFSPATDTPSPPSYHRYLIIGAGPGGLQMSHYLASIDRDYLLLEQNDHVGSFFTKYPRWRQLISINKHETGREELDFNYRHDWNSLLPEPSHSYTPSNVSSSSSPTSTSSTSSYDTMDMRHYSSTDSRYTLSFLNSSLLFRSYTSTYYPEADKLVDYLHHWATLPSSNFSSSSFAPIRGLGRSQPLRIRYRTRILRIEPLSSSFPSPSDPHLPRFRIETTSGTFTCTYLLLGTGLQEMVYPLGTNTMEAIHQGLITTYANASTNLDDYRNRSVLILGRGNAAFEFANNVLEVSSYVHLLGRSSGRIKLAWETHYPGDIRSVHNHLLETYLLKSMDGMAEIPLEHLTFTKGEQGVRSKQLSNGTVITETYQRIAVSDQFTPCIYDDYGRAINRCFFRREYDYVIVCPGWKFSTQLFASSIVPAYHTNQKHPSITAKYESTNVPGLFFVGNLMHAHDAKKSSGGFIHGFRYLVRALHRILEEDERQLYIAMRTTLNSSFSSSSSSPLETHTILPSSTVSLSPPSPWPLIQGHVPQGWPYRSVRGGLRSLVASILRRVNYASGPYQMFGGLADVLVFSPIEETSSASLATLVASYSSRYYRGAGTLAALYHPLSFFDHTAELYRNDRSDLPDRSIDEALYTDILQHQLPLSSPRSSSLLNDPLYIGQEESNQILNTALIGNLYEEVPISLVQEKVRLWYHQQCTSVTRNVRYPLPFICTSDRHHNHIEYLTITLEFGTKGSSVSPVTNETLLMMNMKGEDFIKMKGESSRDPFSRLRANVGLHNPEDSHFLHPVIRYYHTGIDGGIPPTNGPSSSVPPTATLHIIEDFYTDWTHFTAHILPIARFLQHIGHNRIQAYATNLQMYQAWLRSLDTVPSRSVPDPTTVPYRRNYTVSVRSQWNRSRSPSTHSALVDRLMSSPNATLYYKGYRIGGCEGWQHQLTIETIDALLYSPSSSVIVTHFMDPYPTLPLTKEEFQYTLAVYQESVRLRDGLGLLYAKTVPSYYPLSFSENGHPRIQQQSEQYANFLDTYYKNITLMLPGLPVILYRVRNGESRLKFEEFIPRRNTTSTTTNGKGNGTGATTAPGNKLPWVRIFDSSRIGSWNPKGNVIDLDGTDFANLPVKYEEVWKTYFANAKEKN